MNSTFQTLFRCIWHSLETNSSKLPTIHLGKNHNKVFAYYTTTSFSCFFSTEKRLIYFNSAIKAISTRTNHRSSQLMKPCPNGSVTTKFKNSLQAQGVCAILLVYYMSNCIKLKLQRLLGVLENCTEKKSRFRFHNCRNENHWATKRKLRKH